MLRKLVKYDLKVLSKIMIPLWGVMIVFGLIRGMQDQVDNTDYIELIVICFYFIFMINIFIVIQRFYKSMYGQESYLTHTLPVTARQLILSKVISAAIISFITAFIFVLENDILLYMQAVGNQGSFSIDGILIRQVQDLTKMRVIQAVIYMIIYGLFWLIHLIYQAYTAMSIGQLSSKNRFPIMIISGAIIFYCSYAIEIYFRNRTITYTWYDQRCFIIFIVEIMLCHVITEYIVSRKLNLT